MEIALYQPDIPQNVGAMMRLCACMDVPMHIIEPCGFPWDERKFKRTGMDYLTHVNYQRHSAWQKFFDEQKKQKEKRIILMTAHADHSYLDFEFQDDDILMAGRESAGAPDDIHTLADARICIPMHGPTRSLNIVNATSMILGEALRQTKDSERR